MSLSPYTVSSKVSTKSAKLALFQLTFLMLGFSLLVDSVNGFFLSGMGFDPKLSASFKLLLLSLVLFQIGAFSPKALAGCFSAILLLLIGPVFTLTDTYDISAFFLDFTIVLKFLTGIIVFVYCTLLCQRWPHLVKQYGKWVCQTSFFILAFNLILGVFGFGFSSYGQTTADGEGGVGVKGFFYAGNEVSGLIILFFGVMLHLIWQKNKFIYLIFAPFTLLAGVLVATKSAMLAAMLLVFIIPLFNERNRLLNFTWLKVKMILPVVLLGVVLALLLVPMLETTGLWDRFLWFYQKKGIIGLVMSGRDEFVLNATIVYQQFADWFEIIFGFGFSGLSLITKGSMEIDPIDMYFWFGIAGFITFCVITLTFIRTSYLATKCQSSFWGPCVLTINLILLGVSFIAGHIFTSGMLAPFIGLLNGMAYADLCNKSKATSLD